MGCLEIVDCLLKAGAEVNAPPARQRGGTALQLAAAHGHIGLVRHLIDLGADVNAPPTEREGRTALEGAAECGRLDIVKLFLCHGALTTGVGRHHYLRATLLATREGHDAVAELLHGVRD